MSECKINHTVEEVQQKFESQKNFLPSEIVSFYAEFFLETHTQAILNEVFHLLKKYDLADDRERENRNNRLIILVKNL